MKISDYIISFFEQKGIDTIFFLTGGGSMFLNNSQLKFKNIKSIPLLHEHSVIVASASYNQYHNALKSIAIVTTGPGGTNGITGIAAAQLDSVPLVVITGQVKTNDMILNSDLRQKGIQELSFTDIVKPITKYSKTITNQFNINFELNEAYYHAINDRPGASVLSIPLDIQNIEINNDDKLKERIEKHEKHEEQLDNISFKTTYEFGDNSILNLINNSKKSIILAGQGVRISNSIELLKEFADNKNIPILTTWRSIDFLDEEDKLFCGRPGSIASRGSNLILQESDLVICIGARLDFGQIAYDQENFAKNAKLVVVDIDYNEINKFEKAIKYCINAYEFLLYLNENKNFIKKKFTLWLDYCKIIYKKYPLCSDVHYKNKDYINPYIFIKILSDYMGNDNILLPDSSGSASEITLQSFQVKEGQKIFNFPALGSMGFTLGSAIGSVFASNFEKRVVCIAGDGSIQQEIYNLQTVAQYKMPIIIFVFNNDGYKSIRDTHNKFFNAKLGCDKESGLELPNLEKIAYSYNMNYCKIRNHDHNLWGYKLISIQEIMKNIMNENFNRLPMIVEVMIDPNFATQPKVQSFVDKDGRIQSGKLENMWPFEDE
jgi:acetolactate synthase-1/2/3 large subunit